MDVIFATGSKLDRKVVYTDIQARDVHDVPQTILFSYVDTWTFVYKLLFSNIVNEWSKVSVNLGSGPLDLEVIFHFLRGGNYKHWILDPRTGT